MNGTKISKYAEDTEHVWQRISNVLQSLKTNASSIAMWFSENQMAMTKHKCQVLLMFENKKEPFKLDLGRRKVWFLIKILTWRHTYIHFAQMWAEKFFHYLRMQSKLMQRKRGMWYNPS